MVTISSLKLFREEDSLMVALFGEPSALPDGWLENLPAAAVFAASPEGLPLEQALSLAEAAAMVPLLPRFQPSPTPPAAMVSPATPPRLLSTVLRTAHLLAAQLPAEALQPLADQCLAAGRSDLALPLLDALAADPAARLAAARCRCELGQTRAARADLQALVTSPDLADRPDLLAEALGRLAWLDLEAGDSNAARHQLEQLQTLPPEPASLADRDRLARVLATLDWLQQAPPEAVGSSRDLRPEAEVVLALDTVQQTPCGTVLHLEGWRLDPAAAIADLVLLQGGTARRLPLDALRPRQRPDLAEVLQQAGLPPDAPAGFRLALALGVEEAQSPANDGLAALFVLLHSGQQFCLRQSVQPIPLDAQALGLTLADPTP
jgi:hypothetical protein